MKKKNQKDSIDSWHRKFTRPPCVRLVLNSSYELPREEIVDPGILMLRPLGHLVITFIGCQRRNVPSSASGKVPWTVSGCCTRLEVSYSIWKWYHRNVFLITATDYSWFLAINLAFYDPVYLYAKPEPTTGLYYEDFGLSKLCWHCLSA